MNNSCKIMIMIIKNINCYSKRIKINFILFLILSQIINIKIEFLFKSDYFERNNQIKVCLCTPVKKENLYLQEFVEYYKALNVDNIFLYDNNDINGENLDEVLSNYISLGFVKIINFRGKKRALFDMMNHCYKTNYLNFDWLIFYEVDEYIHINNLSNIKQYLSCNKFNNCESIQLIWNMHTDNNQIYYENKSLKDRFPNSIKISTVKSILKGKIPNVFIKSVHKLNSGLKSCNGLGNRINNTANLLYNKASNYYYIDHYYCKSTEEFIKKMNKGDVLYSIDNIQDRINVYFRFNKVTKEKIDFIKNHLNNNITLNFSKYYT